MKKYISLIICAVLLFSLSSCSVGKAPILDNSDNSYFVDFYTDDDYVYIECVLNIYNPNNTESEVKISAIDNEDVEIGLLKSKNLVAIDKESEKDVFRLKSGENTITVLFRGEYAGIYQITSREIPRFIYISEN
ncbi:MAG TPA: hypothetical protein OIM00_09185 [Oscillospiraceae bacterium]|nr:hypothetical protein [Oscillospiraceae bacterium]